MWSCLPLAVSDRYEEERKSVSTLRAESSSTTTMAAARMRRSASRKIDIDTGALVLSEPSSAEMEILAAGNDSLARSVRWPSTTKSVSLWFSYLIEYLGSTLLTYLAGVVEKMDKREYY